MHSKPILIAIWFAIPFFTLTYFFALWHFLDYQCNHQRTNVTLAFVKVQNWEPFFMKLNHAEMQRVSISMAGDLFDASEQIAQ